MYKLLLLVVAVVIISGCIQWTDVSLLAQQAPAVRQFLAEHPGSTIKTIYLSKENVFDNLNQIKTDCGDKMEVASYYKTTINSTNLTLLAYTNEAAQRLDCLIVKDLNTGEITQLPKETEENETIRSDISCRVEYYGVDTCPEGYVCQWSQACPFSEEPIQCGPPTGDLLCHKVCESNADCAGTGMPVCKGISQFEGDVGRFVKMCVKEETNTNPIVCTEEAKLCADGSYVARMPPNCEFAPCPEANNDIVIEGQRISLSCKEDYNCQLFYRESRLKCCLWPPGRVDYSDGNWTSVNSSSLYNAINNVCTKQQRDFCTRAYPMPPIFVNTNYTVKCVDNVCQKVKLQHGVF